MGRVFFSSLSLYFKERVYLELHKSAFKACLYYLVLVTSEYLVHSRVTFFEKERHFSLLFLSFLFSIYTYLMRQNREMNVKVLRHYVPYLCAVLETLQMKCHFGFCAFMGKAKGHPYDKQFRFTPNLHVSFHPTGRGNSTWQSVENVRQSLLVAFTNML